MKNLSKQSGVALVIILAFIVLLTGISVAFLSRSLTSRQVSNASVNQAKADALARGASEIVIADLKQEIINGSTASQPLPQPESGTIYMPKTNANIVPVRGETPAVQAVLPNLIRRSVRGGAGTALPVPGVISAVASAVNSTTDPAFNGQSVSLARWNSHYLLPRGTASTTIDSTPQSPLGAPYNSNPVNNNGFTPPDWVMVTREGPKVLAAPDNTAIGRYAYAIYDEGGLLDINVAGYPEGPNATTPSQYAYKSSLAYADLKTLLTVAGNSTTTSNKVVGWRNYASIQPTGDLLGGYNYTTAAATRYFNYVIGNQNGFLYANAKPYPAPATAASRSDQLFSSRQALLRFRRALSMSQDALQYLTTFSRGLDQPSFVPLVHQNYGSAPKVLPLASGGTNAVGLDREINPSYLTVRVQKQFTRNDGSTAHVGDFLINKRFALNRLAWLTYKGPSASNMTDPVVQKTITALGGSITAGSSDVIYQFLAQGTAANIQKYFGLNWGAYTDPATGVSSQLWLYNLHNNRLGVGKGPIMRVGRNPAVDPTADQSAYVQDLATPRDPDFFEILKSALTVGSLGKSLTNGATAVSNEGGASAGEQPYNFNFDNENSPDLQVMQIGANIINQTHLDNYPVRIVFDDGLGNRNANPSSTARIVAGISNLPYSYQILNGVLQVRKPSPLPRNLRSANPAIPYSGALGAGTSGDSGYQPQDTIAFADSGAGAIMQLPVVWNPHDPSGPPPVDGPTSFRIVADSTTPDQITPGGSGNYASFFANASSYTPPEQQGNRDSFDALEGSVNSTWYRSATRNGSEIAHKITASNSEIDFTVASNTAQLFPEPTILLRKATITDSNGNAVTVSVGGNHLMTSDPAVRAHFADGGIPNWIPNATGFPSSASPYPLNTPYLGFYMGAFPWAWIYSPTSAPASAAQSGVQLRRVGSSTGGSANSCYLTYRMQCMDVNNVWVTYDTKYGKAINGPIDIGSIAGAPTGALLAQNGYWGSVTDPRTSRFGVQWNGTGNSPGVNNAVYSTTGLPYSMLADPFLSYQNAVIKTGRPDAQGGYYFMASWVAPGMPGARSGWEAWIGSDSGASAGVYKGIAPGLLSQNNTDIYYTPTRTYGDGSGANTHTPNYFADPDGVVRRGMGAHVPLGTASSPSLLRNDTSRMVSADTTVGLPIGRAFGAVPPLQAGKFSPTTTNYSSGSSLSQAQSRPYFLHRPFRSVAELGCVFSDTPWRNLDFFTAESGSLALLDVFSITENDNPTALTAGKVNLNTRQAPVIAAVLGGSSLDIGNVTGANSVTKPMDATTATKLASALNAYIVANGPLQNLSDLVGRWVSNKAIASLGGLLTGTNKGVLGAGFIDGKTSYMGFSGGQWDSSTHKPKVVNDSAGSPTDVFTVYNSATAFGSNTNHNGTRETMAYIQRFREAPVRSLASSGETRVWNLLIDVVAQTGRYPATATTLDKFAVEGEQRYWVHVAIDRYTGQVIDKQIEVVKE